GGDSGFHVAHAAAVDASVAHDTAERLDRPSIAGGHDVEVAVQVHDRTWTSAPRADDVHARVRGCVLRPSVGGDVLDLEPAPRQLVADRVRAHVVRVAGRIDRGNAHEIGREGHNLVGGAIDFGKDAVGVSSRTHRQAARLQYCTCVLL